MFRVNKLRVIQKQGLVSFILLLKRIWLNYKIGIENLIQQRVATQRVAFFNLFLTYGSGFPHHEPHTNFKVRSNQITTLCWPLLHNGLWDTEEHLVPINVKRKPRPTCRNNAPILLAIFIESSENQDMRSGSKKIFVNLPTFQNFFFRSLSQPVLVHIDDQ